MHDGLYYIWTTVRVIWESKLDGNKQAMIDTKVIIIHNEQNEFNMPLLSVQVMALLNVLSKPYLAQFQTASAPWYSEKESEPVKQKYSGFMDF